MLLGTLGLYLGLMVQRFGVEIAATMIALTAALYVHPSWSKRVSKLNFLVIGLIAAKPVTFLVVGAAFGVIGDNLSTEQLTSSPANVLGGLTIAAVGIVFAGLAPMALLKWAPVLSIGHSGSGGGMVTSAAIGAGSASLMNSMQNSRSRQSKSTSTSTSGGQGESGQHGQGGTGSAGGGPNLVSALDAKSSAALAGSAGSAGSGAAGAAGKAGGAGAAKGAAAAGGAAATGGASAIAQVAQAAAQKAHQAAHNHVPDVDGPEDGDR